MAEHKVLVCDICGAAPARRVAIIMEDDGDSSWRIDLCIDQHMKPVTGLLPHARQSRMPSKTGGSYEKVTPEHLLAEVKRAKKK